MSRRFIAAMSLAVTAVMTVPVAALALRKESVVSVDTSVVRTAAHRPPVEHPSCPIDAENPLSTSARDGITVSVQVPAIAMVKVDSHGTVVAAATNTGCAPRTGDLVYLYRANGIVERSTTFVLARHRWIGDFRTPGVFQPQSTDSNHD
jgi:hypothetical protein